jgi:hypothetical protein
MGDGAWYAKAKRALRETQTLVLLIPSPTASRMREHLFALSKREGGFKEIFYMSSSRLLLVPVEPHVTL